MIEQIDEDIKFGISTIRYPRNQVLPLQNQANQDTPSQQSKEESRGNSSFHSFNFVAKKNANMFTNIKGDDLKNFSELDIESVRNVSNKKRKGREKRDSIANSMKDSIDVGRGKPKRKGSENFNSRSIIRNVMVDRFLNKKQPPSRKATFEKKSSSKFSKFRNSSNNESREAGSRDLQNEEMRESNSKNSFQNSRRRIESFGISSFEKTNSEIHNKIEEEENEASSHQEAEKEKSKDDNESEKSESILNFFKIFFSFDIRQKKRKTKKKAADVD